MPEFKLNSAYSPTADQPTAIDQITELNPNLDPQLIQPGNCVDLRIDGCKALAGEP